ncbi:MAG: hypothetical protein JKX79_10695 [Labilibaculum sp.]|nr:hypothetical protein [Labilibaculum sp.]
MRYLFSILFFCLSFQLVIGQDMPDQNDNNHDISSLHSWGPYSKRYAGISHIPDMQQGLRFDFSVMPGYYRNRQLVPHVLFESSYYPWKINPEMDNITYRYELEWKDNVFIDVTYHLLDDARVLVESRCVNNTSINQNLVLNNIAYIAYPEKSPNIKINQIEDSRLQWYNAIDYAVNEPANKTARYRLVYDGWHRNEERTSQSLDGSVFGRGFGKDKGDKVVYKVDILEGLEEGLLSFRYKLKKGERAVFNTSGLINKEVNFEGTGDFVFLSIPYKCDSTGEHILELTSEGKGAISLDGFFIGSVQTINSINTISTKIPFTPKIEKGKSNRDFLLKYEECSNFYGVAWNFQDSEIREILNDELESFFRKKVHDHVSSRLTGNRKWHYTNAFLRPIVLGSNSEKILYSLICTGDKEYVKKQLETFHTSPQEVISKIRKEKDDLKNSCLSEGEKYRLGQQLLQAAVLSNVVYPVYTQRQYIRHFTPGKNWNSLYTWDSGFISLGLIDIDREKAYEVLKAYTTPVGNESAFIHHGTPLPIQIFAYFDLWNNNLSKEQFAYLYPRLKRYFDFMAGVDPYSTTRMKGSGLLNTWDYFYNSGGWDDYPPQKARSNRLVTPVVSSAYYLRAAKILRMAAKELGEKKDVKHYDAIINTLLSALQKYAWDDKEGYFSYVIHDDEGNAKEIFRYKDGSNFNRGLDGISPLVSGICNPKQTGTLIKHLFSPKELWTNVGISTVDQSAPYYKSDGYWNGAVWFPHQWVMWKALLDNGKGDEAYKIASTALDTWQKECSETYHTFEHFIIASGRGAGWHQFSGLSSPLLNFYATYYRVGKVSTGFEIWINDGSFNHDHSQYEAKISFDDSTTPHERTMIVIMNPDYNYSVKFRGKSLCVKSYYPGMLQITFPANNKSGILVINPI